MGLLPKGSHCKESFVTDSGVERCVSYTKPKNWQALYRRADHARVGWRPLKQFDRPMKRDEVRQAIRQRKAGGWAYKGYGESYDHPAPQRVPRWPLEGVGSTSVGGRQMAKRPYNKGKKCKRYGTATRKGKRVRVCKSYGGGRKTAAKRSSSKGKGKGPCKRWSKKVGNKKRRCLKRG
jgi:hypothetical protein